MLLEIAEAMESLHGLQILHRDLKSLNVLVRRNGRKWEMKLTDFGLARTPAPEIMTTQLGTIVHIVLCSIGWHLRFWKVRHILGLLMCTPMGS